MNDPFNSLLPDLGLDPITVALTNPKHHHRLCHLKLSLKDPLYNLYSLLLFHRQGYGCFHTLT